MQDTATRGLAQPTHTKHLICPRRKLALYLPSLSEDDEISYHFFL